MPSGILATGAGAAGGLEELLARMLAEDKFKQQSQLETGRLSEETRHNTANEGIERDRNTETARQRELQQQQLRQQQSIANADREASAAATEKDRSLTRAQTSFKATPAGTELGTDDPTVKDWKGAGFGSLLKLVPRNLESTEMTGSSKGLELGKLNLRSVGAKPDRYVRQPDAQQVEASADNARQDKAGAEQATRDAETRRHDLVAENKPPATVVVNTVDDKGNPVAKIVPKVAGAEYAKPAPTSVQDARAKKRDARATLDRLDKDIEMASSRNLIGPIKGRISDLEQRIGDPDPAISTLAARMVAAKMQVDAGIGGMRGAASAQLLARWDKLLGSQLNAANLHAVAQVMREMVEDNDATPGADPATGGGQTIDVGGFKVRVKQ